MEKTEKKMLKKIKKMEKTGKINLELHTPITVEKSENYLLVIKDAEDVHHYFKQDGSYDGYDRPCKC